MSVATNMTDGLQDAIRQHADVIVGHDAVHPDRDACGGVGGCALMRAEVDAEQDIRDRLEGLARKKVSVVVTPASAPKAAKP